MTKMIRRSIAVLLVIFAPRAHGQQPAAPSPPLRGRVMSMAGLPIAGAEVRVEDVKTPVTTDTRGLFLVPNVRKGIHTVSVRRIGYLPATVSVQYPQAGESFTVTLLPLRAALDTVRVTAQANVLAGVVVDEHNRPMAGASVALGGGRRATDTTGTDGWFTFMDVRAGPTVLRVLHPGYVGTMLSVSLEDWRGVVVHMTRIDSTLSKTKQRILSGLGATAQNVWLETQTRLARRDLRSVVITSEELADFGDLPLGEAIERTRIAGKLLPELQRSNSTACVLLNGYQMIGQTSLNTYDADDVEFVELYPPNAQQPASIAAYMRDAGCMRMSPQGGIFYAAVWMKN